MATCLICGSVLEDVGGRGRPKSYCNTACRRMAELAIKRCDHRIAELEDQLSRERTSPLHTIGFDAGLVEAELARQNARLRELLSRATKRTR